MRSGQALVRTVILIHGAGGGSWEWQKWEPIFVQRGWATRSVHLVPSSRGIAATTIEDYSKQVQHVVSTLDSSKIALVGASMGGLLALLAASTHHVDATVLVNTVTPKGFRTKAPSPPVIEWANQPIEGTVEALPDCSEEIIQRAWKSWRDESGAVLNALAAGFKVDPLPTCPALVVIGADDTDISPDSNLALARQLHADVHIYAGTSHVGPLLGHRAAEIAAATESWLDVHVKQ